MLPVIFSTLVLAGVAVGQSQPSTNATCSPAFAWASNSLGQSPCLVAAYLGSVCDNGLFMVPALANDLSSYQGPDCGTSQQMRVQLRLLLTAQRVRGLPIWKGFNVRSISVG
ncbi:hypothetical protein MVEN_02038800 [Mycena venus]|uniref:Uncharacterized protein n=1 Tax=Mycena venus TaxID=2733690 RepID=A0A8H7CI00_9AGAR|nr:hypothetical protein MVEN_02038800 [Mycena venus]